MNGELSNLGIGIGITLVINEATGTPDELPELPVPPDPEALAPDTPEFEPPMILLIRAMPPAAKDKAPDTNNPDGSFHLMGLLTA
jgi:hypothetical protein